MNKYYVFESYVCAHGQINSPGLIVLGDEDGLGNVVGLMIDVNGNVSHETQITVYLSTNDPYTVFHDKDLRAACLFACESMDKWQAEAAAAERAR